MLQCQRRVPTDAVKLKHTEALNMHVRRVLDKMCFMIRVSMLQALPLSLVGAPNNFKCLGM